MKTLNRAILEKITRQNARELDYGRDWQHVACPYCNDSGHLAMERHWVVVGAIPHEVNAADYYLPARRCELVYIPCDCNGSSADQPKRRFQERFGEPIRSHWYGRRLMEVRHELNRKLQKGYQPGADGHMHTSEAWEALDSDIPDPPEAVWADDDADLPPF